MDNQTQIQHLKTLCNQAREQSDQISTQLESGATPEKLVPILKQQAETIAQFQNQLVQFAQSGEASAFSQDIEQLKNDFQSLIQTSDKHVQKAQQKGVRLPGIGGKRHVPRPVIREKKP